MDATRSPGLRFSIGVRRPSSSRTRVPKSRQLPLLPPPPLEPPPPEELLERRLVAVGECVLAREHLLDLVLPLLELEILNGEETWDGHPLCAEADNRIRLTAARACEFSQRHRRGLQIARVLARRTGVPPGAGRFLRDSVAVRANDRLASPTCVVGKLIGRVGVRLTPAARTGYLVDPEEMDDIDHFAVTGRPVERSNHLRYLVPNRIKPRVNAIRVDRCQLKLRYEARHGVDIDADTAGSLLGRFDERCAATEERIQDGKAIRKRRPGIERRPQIVLLEGGLASLLGKQNHPEDRAESPRPPLMHRVDGSLTVSFPKGKP